MGCDRRPRLPAPRGSRSVGPLHVATAGGQIFSLFSGRELSPTVGGNGRYGVTIRTHESDRLARREVHVLVCRAFHGERPSDRHIVSHLNGDKLDNHPSNLAWETWEKNRSRTYEHGTDDRGFHNSRACVTPEQVGWVRANPDGLTHQAMADRLGVSRTSISRIVNKKRFTEEKEEE